MSEDAQDFLSYVTSNTMATIASTLALAANVTALDCTELWTLDSYGNYYCPYVYATDELQLRCPNLLVGQHPRDKLDFLSPKLCENAKVSPKRYHWRTFSTYQIPSVGTEVPFLTEVAYHIQNTNDIDIFIVGFATKKLQFKPSTLKFLEGLGYAIYVSAFLMTDNEGHDDAITEASNVELDLKEFVPRSSISTPFTSGVNMAQMQGKEMTVNISHEANVKDRSYSWSYQDQEQEESYCISHCLDDEQETFDAQAMQARYDIQTSNRAPTWGPAYPFSYPVGAIASDTTIPVDLTNNNFYNVTHIADGSNSNIYTAQFQGGKVVIKMIKEEMETDPIALHEFDLEYGMLSRIKHPHVIKILGAGYEPRQFMVLEYLSGGSLHDLLAQNEVKRGFASMMFRKPTFTYIKLLQLASAMAEALDYLHFRCHPGATIIHRDLKPDNVGFTADGTLKLFDFGLVTCVKTRESTTDCYTMTGYTGSLRYMAPEVALCEPYNEKVDVYSFGIMLWQMARDNLPFTGLGKTEFMQEVVRGNVRPKLDRSWPDGFSNLLTACWARDPEKRPSFSVIVMELNALMSGVYIRRRAAESQVRVAKMSGEADFGGDDMKMKGSSLSTASEITREPGSPGARMNESTVTSYQFRTPRSIADGLGSRKAKQDRQDWAKDLSYYSSYGEQTLQLKEVAEDEWVVGKEFEFVSAVLKRKIGVSSCSLVFDALKGNPVCLIRVSSTEIMGECIDIARNTKAMHISVIVAVDAALAHECDEEFSTFDGRLWDQLDWTLLMEKNQNLTSILHSFEFHSHATVIFGPRYDYETESWTSEVSIWVCMRDFTWKSFLKKKSEFRTTDHSGLYVHYWVLDLDEQVKLSSQNDVRAWHKSDGQKIMPGCSFLLDVNHPDVNPIGTIGPSLHTLFPENFYLQNWFLTCSHTFFGHIGDYEFRAIVGENNLLCAEEPHHPIGKLVHYFDKFDLAVVSIETNYNHNVKLSNATSMDVPAHEYLQKPVTATLLNEYKKRYVYKSGGTTGVTRGTVVTYGMECGGIGRYGQFPRAQYVFVQVKPTVLFSFSTPKFSDFGDSGGPVFFDEYTPPEARADPSTADAPLKVPPTCIGLVSTGSSSVDISGVRLFPYEMCGWLASLQNTP